MSVAYARFARAHTLDNEDPRLRIGLVGCLDRAREAHAPRGVSHKCHAFKPGYLDRIDGCVRDAEVVSQAHANRAPHTELA